MEGRLRKSLLLGMVALAVAIAAMLTQAYRPAHAYLFDSEFTEEFINSSAGISTDELGVFVSGTVSCTAEESVQIDVSVVQSSTGAFAVGGWQDRCTGETQDWDAEAFVEGNPLFEAGEAEACATARTRSSSGSTDIFQGCTDIEVEQLLE